MFNIAEFEEKQAARIQKQLEINRLSEQIETPKFKMPPPIELSRDDLMDAFHKKFPDCRVVCRQLWYDPLTNTNMKHNWGITIDWT
jgi:hypothetical protein